MIHRVKELFYDIKYGIKSLLFYFPVIWKDRSWDYVFMLMLEQHKLKQMLEHHEKYRTFEEVENVIRDLKLCIELLDIVIEDDFRSKKYVNFRNKDRFDKGHNVFYKQYPGTLRNTKAWYLYNKIKTYKLDNWWD